ncbi:fibronectin type III domain-containing protein [Actinoplanes sp. NPDC049118]|uniref:fibronectin type III domain-containing protein n=1 Tax=Actinoplanes sp. NPDC049118 TaxID=3155769 RepID=UPI0033F7C7E8
MTRRPGVLCTAAALVPLVLGGCAVSSTAGAEENLAAEATPAAQSWIVVAGGSAKPTPPASRAPSAAPAESGFGGLPPVSAPPAPAADVRPGEPQCVKAHPQGRIEVAMVSPGRTTATVTWYHPGDTSVIAYRVAGISQELVVGQQPELSWTVVEPGRGCREMTATVRGLQPATSYVFAVNATRIRHSSGSAYNVTVARSRAVVTAG